jgi:hypothetical protein
LPDGTVRAVVQALDARIRRDAADDEQRWMLAWYHASSPDLFALYGASIRLIDEAESTDPDAWRDAGITRTAMALRGQMGRYWSELAGGVQ